MNTDEVRQFRSTAFQVDVIDSFRAEFRNRTEWTIGGAFEKLIKVVDPKKQTSTAEVGDFVHGEYGFEDSALQVRMLALIDELRLVEFGYTEGYYPAAAYIDAIEYMMESDAMAQHSRLLPSIGYFLKELQPFWRHGILMSRTSTGLFEGEVNFNDTLFAWRDAANDEFFECARLLLFADSEEWRERSSRLAALATRMYADPSLSITSQEANDIEWGLNGAEPFFDHSVNDVRWSTTYATVEKTVTRNPDNRLVWLQQIRDRIAQSANFLTTDQSAAALRRLGNPVEDSRPGWPG